MRLRYKKTVNLLRADQQFQKSEVDVMVGVLVSPVLYVIITALGPIPCGRGGPWFLDILESIESPGGDLEKMTVITKESMVE